MFPLETGPDVARVVEEDLRHRRHRVGPGPVALQVSPEHAPRDRHHPRLHHSLNCHLVRLDTHATGSIGYRVDLIAFAGRLKRGHHKSRSRSTARR